jgi:hypothetical protein
MDTVYIETTVVGHVVGRLHPNSVIAAVNGVKYLVTWNFKHIANAIISHSAHWSRAFLHFPDVAILV